MLCRPNDLRVPVLFRDVGIVDSAAALDPTLKHARGAYGPGIVGRFSDIASAAYRIQRTLCSGGHVDTLSFLCARYQSDEDMALRWTELGSCSRGHFDSLIPDRSYRIRDHGTSPRFLP